MNYKVIFTLLIVLSIIATLCISTIKPPMHKSVFVYNSDYAITPTQEVVAETKEIPILEQPASSEVKKIEINQQSVIPVQNTEILRPEQIKTQKIETKPAITVASNPVNVQNTKITNQETTSSVKNEQTPPNQQIDLQKIVQNNKNIQNPATTVTQNAPLPVKTAPSEVKNSSAPIKVTQPKSTIPAPTAQKVLTVQEEEVAWNIWRSNLNNKIMQDTNFPQVEPNTVFRYEFSVDKYGKITNVQTWSDTSKYTPYAIQYLAPVIRNLQGRSILNFPKGTQRTSTKAQGAWKISDKTVYSAPSDYNDVEKVPR